MVSKHVSGLKTGTSNNRTIHADDIGDIIASKAIVLHGSESCPDPDISSRVHTEIDADLGIVVHEGCDLTLVIGEPIDLQPKWLRVVQWLTFVKGALVVNTAICHVVEIC